MRWVPSFKTIMLRFFFFSCDFLSLMTGNDCDDILRHTAHIIEHRNLKKKKIYFAADLYLWVYDDSFSNENWGTDDDESGKGRSIHFLSSTQIAYSIMRFDLRLMILFRKQTLLIQWTCLSFLYLIWHMFDDVMLISEIISESNIPVERDTEYRLTDTLKIKKDRISEDSYSTSCISFTQESLWFEHVWKAL